MTIPKRMMNIEDSYAPLGYESLDYNINLKFTTERDLYRLMALKYLEPDPYEGISNFLGQVYTVSERFQDQPDSPLMDEMERTFQTKYLRCKVRAPDLHAYLPIPSTFGDNKDDRMIISLYPDFYYSYKEEERLAPGDFVKVTFQNLKTKAMPTIISKFASAADGQGTVTPSGASTRSSKVDLFKYPPDDLFANTNDPWLNRLYTKFKKYNLSGPYESIIDKYGSKFGIDTNLIKAFISVESVFNPSARSPVGATGLMQLMPITVKNYTDPSYNYKQFAAEFGQISANPFSPEQNIFIGCLVIQRLMKKYPSDLQKVAAGYNWGDGHRVGGKKTNPEVLSIPGWKEYLAQINNTETLNYIKRVPGMYELIKKG